jgi:hypothetical protein
LRSQPSFNFSRSHRFVVDTATASAATLFQRQFIANREGSPA